MNKRVGRTLSACIALTATLACGAASADMNRQMDNMFGSMANVTRPGAYSTQTRGVFTGGSIQVRNRIVTPNVISLTPPGYSAGCGGLNLHMGSFSYANADEFVGLFRAVAANAKGYAFKLALDAYAPSIMQQMESVAQVVRSFNQHFANSCQLAQGILNEVPLPARMEREKSDARISGMVRGYGDAFETWKNTREAASQEHRDNVLNGNLVWRGLVLHRVDTWFAGGDDPLMEAIMSLTGTVVVTEREPGGGAQSGELDQNVTRYNRTLTLQDLVDGGEVQMWRCPAGQRAAHECLDLGGAPQTVNFVGMKTRLEELLIGNPATQTPGYLQLLAGNQGSLSPQQQAMIANLPFGIQAMLTNLAALNHGLAEQFAHQYAATVATVWAYTLSKAMLEAAAAANAVESAHAGEVTTMLADVHTKLNQEFNAALAQTGNLSDVMDGYHSYLKAADARFSLVSRTGQGRDRR